MPSPITKLPSMSAPLLPTSVGPHDSLRKDAEDPVDRIVHHCRGKSQRFLRTVLKELRRERWDGLVSAVSIFHEVQRAQRSGPAACASYKELFAEFGTMLTDRQHRRGSTLHCKNSKTNAAIEEVAFAKFLAKIQNWQGSDIELVHESSGYYLKLEGHENWISRRISLLLAIYGQFRLTSFPEKAGDSFFQFLNQLDEKAIHSLCVATGCQWNEVDLTKLSPESRKLALKYLVDRDWADMVDIPDGMVEEEATTIASKAETFIPLTDVLPKYNLTYSDRLKIVVFLQEQPDQECHLSDLYIPNQIDHLITILHPTRVIRPGDLKRWLVAHTNTVPRIFVTNSLESSDDCILQLQQDDKRRKRHRQHYIKNDNRQNAPTSMMAPLAPCWPTYPELSPLPMLQGHPGNWCPPMPNPFLCPLPAFGWEC